MSFLNPHCWFALQVLHQHEAKVASLLEYKGYEHFYPTYMPFSRRKAHFAGRPLFPGYVFCRTTELSTGLICCIPGVIRFVNFGGKAAPIPATEIDALRRSVKSDVDAWPFVPYVEIGQKVEVTKGPLLGVIGRLISVRNRNRLLICVEMVMQAITVDVDVNDIVPLGARA